MKKVLTIAGGVVLGAVALLGVAYLVGKKDSKDNFDKANEENVVIELNQ